MNFPLAPESIWTFQVSPRGDVIKAVQTSQADRSKTQTEWLDPATLDKTQIKTDFPPSQSIASDGAEVAKVKDCLVFRDKSVGSPRNICCHDECGRGVPLYVYDSSLRQSVGNASIKYSGREFAFALSPSGQTLALLTGDTVYLYEFAK